jgi:indole-3-glycerol phosphate synthase
MIRALQIAGYRGFLMGETFMKTSNPGKALKDLVCLLNE